MSIVTRILDASPQPKKRQRYGEGAPEDIDTLPAEWRGLAAQWVKRTAGATSCYWNTLAKDAGADYPLAQHLLEWLLSARWIVVTEERRHGAWWPTRVEFLEIPRLRSLLGIPDPAEPARQWAELRAGIDFAQHPDLTAAMVSLDGLPAARAVTRTRLLQALSRWRQVERTGTRRDFSHFARGDTKAITDAEWRWLEDAVDLAADGIERHTPLLLIAAPLVLGLPNGTIALDGSPDFSALTPATLAALTSVSGSIGRWRLIENQTSFERCARSREEDTGVVWLPGFPPGWWREAMTKLIALAPAPAEIACDPDPAGIAIAMEAGRLWDAAGQPWLPWNMGAADLDALRVRKPLTEMDRRLIDSLLAKPLPEELVALANRMLDSCEKGEQEGYL